MYSLGIEANTGRLKARNMVTGSIRVPEIDPVVRIITDHTSAMVWHDRTRVSMTLLHSVDPWKALPITMCEDTPLLRPGLRRRYVRCIIGDCVFEAFDDLLTESIIYICDASKCDKLTNLCILDSREHYNFFDLVTANWRGHAWMSAGVSWGPQCLQSRELCTFVDMNTYETKHWYSWCPPLATGNGRLYGLAVPTMITALDPRETSAAKVVYADVVRYDNHIFRDVSNGIAMLSMLQYDDIITIFDERACAMIGTSMQLQGGCLFCPCAFKNE